MLVNMKPYLIKAKKDGYAVPQFNINNLEWTRFILEACEEKKSPVILGVSESAASYMGGYKLVTNIVVNLIDYLEITVPVILHLDHGKTEDSCIEAIDAGFTSVMIDASLHSIEENIKITNKVIEYAEKHNVSVEGEIGYIGSNSNDVKEKIDINQIIKYANETNLDALAPALGSVHGIYHGEPNLDFNTMKVLKEKLDIPLVLHGGSGIDNERIQQAIKNGICKLNINTDLQIAWTSDVKKYLQETNEYDPRKIIKSGEQSLKQVVYNKIDLLGSSNKA